MSEDEKEVLKYMAETGTQFRCSQFVIKNEHHLVNLQKMGYVILFKCAPLWVGFMEDDTQMYEWALTYSGSKQLKRVKGEWVIRDEDEQS
jgi:hypothetical protein